MPPARSPVSNFIRAKACRNRRRIISVCSGACWTAYIIAYKIAYKIAYIIAYKM